MAGKKRYYVDDGYYDPQLELATAIPAIAKGATAAGRKVGETARGVTEYMTAGLRRPVPVHMVRRGENGYAKLYPWIRIGIVVALWLLGIYLIRKLLQNWVLGGLAWIAGVGVNFDLETKYKYKDTGEDYWAHGGSVDDRDAKVKAGTVIKYTDFTQVLKNSFLNPLALIWTVVFVLMLMNMLPEVRYAE